jgi:hypothetical protein
MSLANDQTDNLYKFSGILWQIHTNSHGKSWVNDPPLCPREGCRSELKQVSGNYLCEFCEKEYPCPKGYQKTHEDAERKWNGYMLRHANVYSLELPPTKVVDEAQDDNYWVQARISEKGGKRMAVVYFGEKVRGEQNERPRRKRTGYLPIWKDEVPRYARDDAVLLYRRRFAPKARLCINAIVIPSVARDLEFCFSLMGERRLTPQADGVLDPLEI